MSTNKTERCCEFPEGCCRLILIGKSGSGKSSTGNSILGKNIFEESIGICTGTVHSAIHVIKRNNIHIQVMDTPGLSDPDEKDDVIIERINEMMFAMHPGPHALLLVVRCNARFTKEDYQVYLTYKDIFGQDLASHMIIIFTGKDELPRGFSFDKQIQDKEKNIYIHKVLDDADNRYLLFNNKGHEVEKELQFNALLSTVTQIVHANGGPLQHTFTEDIEGPMQRMTMEEIQTRSNKINPNLTQMLMNITPSSSNKPKRKLKKKRHKPRDPKNSTQDTRTVCTLQTVSTTSEKKSEIIPEVLAEHNDRLKSEHEKPNLVKEMVKLFSPQKQSGRNTSSHENETVKPVTAKEPSMSKLSATSSKTETERASPVKSSSLSSGEQRRGSAQTSDRNWLARSSEKVGVTQSRDKGQGGPISEAAEIEEVTEGCLDQQLTELMTEYSRFEHLDDVDDSVADEWRQAVLYYAEMVLKSRIINDPEKLSEIQRDLFSSILPGLKEKVTSGLSHRSVKAQDMCTLM